MNEKPVHKLGSHWQAGVKNAAGGGVVQHTDYIHPEFGYSRFDGHVPEALCYEYARRSHARRFHGTED